MRVEVLTLFPEMFPGPLGSSILRRAMQAGYLGVRLHNFRDYARDRHHTVDDYPYGGGAGMVLKPAPLFAAVEAVHALPPPPPGLHLHSPGAPDIVFVEGGAEAEVPPGNDSPAEASIEADTFPVILLSPQGERFSQA